MTFLVYTTLFRLCLIQWFATRVQGIEIVKMSIVIFHPIHPSKDKKRLRTTGQHNSLLTVQTSQASFVLIIFVPPHPCSFREFQKKKKEKGFALHYDIVCLLAKPAEDGKKRNSVFYYFAVIVLRLTKVILFPRL